MCQALKEICLFKSFKALKKKFLDNTERKFKYLNFYFVVKFLFITPLVVKSREISKY